MAGRDYPKVVLGGMAIWKEGVNVGGISNLYLIAYALDLTPEELLT